MRIRPLAIALASAIALTACGGGGGTATGPGAPAIPAATAVPSVAPAAAASIPMSIAIPRKSSSSGSRAPRFLSPDTSSLAFYDGTTLIYVANLSLDSSTQFATVFAKSGSTIVAPGTCSFTSTTATCTITVTSTIGAHKFDLIAYDVKQGQQPATDKQRAVSDTGTPPTFTGIISSEGELSVTLSPGTNPAATLTMLGVADTVIIAGPANGPYNAATQFGYRIQDVGNAQIVTPGDYDNGPITITAAPSGIVTIAPNSFTTPPTSGGDQFFNVTCVNAAGGNVTISFNANTHPNAAYASGLTYTTSNYSGASIATQPFSCDPSTATVPINVQ